MRKLRSREIKKLAAGCPARKGQAEPGLAPGPLLFNTVLCGHAAEEQANSEIHGCSPIVEVSRPSAHTSGQGALRIAETAFLASPVGWEFGARF